MSLGRFGALRALLGYPRACLGPIFEGFGMDLEVCTAKEEGIHNEKNDVVSPLQTLQDLPLQVPGLRAASKPMPTTTRRTPLWYRCPSLFSPYLEDRGPQIGLGGRRVAQTFFLSRTEFNTVSGSRRARARSPPRAIATTWGCKCRPPRSTPLPPERTRRWRRARGTHLPHGPSSHEPRGSECCKLAWLR